MVYAGTVSRSFAEAAELMRHLAEAPASAKQVERLTRRVEMIEQRHGRVPPPGSVALYHCRPAGREGVGPAK